MRIKRTNLIGTLPDRLESRSCSGCRDLAPDIWCPGCTDLWVVRAPSRALLGPLLRHTKLNIIAAFNRIYIKEGKEWKTAFRNLL